MKKKVVVLAVFLAFVLIISNLGIVDAQFSGLRNFLGGGGGDTSDPDNRFIPNFIETSDLWDAFTDPQDISAVGEFAKLIILLLAVFLIYGALAYVTFPRNAGLRWLVAIAVGFLATVLITQEEILSALLAYKALGVTLMLFVPILILGFFTFVVSIKVAAFGILLQRIAWVIYSVYLFITALGLTLVRWGAGSSRGFFGEITQGRFFEFLFGKELIDRAAGTGDSVILIVLWIAAIAIFIIFVYKNDALNNWVQREMREADKDRYKDVIERAKMARELEAGATRSSPTRDT